MTKRIISYIIVLFFVFIIINVNCKKYKYKIPNRLHLSELKLNGNVKSLKNSIFYIESCSTEVKISKNLESYPMEDNLFDMSLYIQFNKEGNLQKKWGYDENEKIKDSTIYSYENNYIQMYFYDKNGKLKHTDKQKYKYNPKGELIEKVDYNRTMTYEKGKLIQIKFPDYIVKYKYDDKGNLIKSTTYDNDNKIIQKPIENNYHNNYTYSYHIDTIKYIAKKDDKNNIIELNSYDKNNNLLQERKYKYTYDYNDNLIEFKNIENGKKITHIKHHFEYDEKQNWIERLTCVFAENGYPKYKKNAYITKRIINYY